MVSSVPYMVLVFLRENLLDQHISKLSLSITSLENMSLEDKIHIIERVIGSKGKLEITYFRKNNEKSKLAVSPAYVGE